MGQKVYSFRVLLFISSIAKKRTRPSTAKKKKKKAFFFSTAKKRRRPSSLQATKTPASKLRSLLRCSNKQAPEPEKLRSLLCCSSKQARQLPELAALQQASSGAREAPELTALQQQASSGAYCVAGASKPKSFRSLLRCNKQDPELLELAALLQQASSRAPKKFRSLLCCSSKQARELPELAALEQVSPGASGACCVGASKPESFRSLLRWSKQAPEPEKLWRSSGACCVAAASKPGSFRSLLRYNKQDPELLELTALQQQVSSGAPESEKLRTSSEARCVATTSKLQSRRSSGACSVAT